MTDHPRIRGEHVIPSRNVNGVTGSSPHTRGARLTSSFSAALQRIIPAYAGSTASASQISRIPRDHPRIRGEHIKTAAGWLGQAGSSPHTRGAPQCGIRGRCRSGIIPAYAGSTPPGARLRPGPGDHPRIRGEHATCCYPSSPKSGSSPHTRGARAK